MKWLAAAEREARLLKRHKPLIRQKTRALGRVVKEAALVFSPVLLKFYFLIRRRFIFWDNHFELVPLVVDEDSPNDYNNDEDPGNKFLAHNASFAQFRSQACFISLTGIGLSVTSQAGSQSN